MTFPFYWLIFIMQVTFWAPTLFAQGSIVIVPMSKHALTQDEVISFRVHNQLNSAVMIDLTFECDVDGQSLTAEECRKYFELKIAGEVNPKKIEIPKTGNVGADVKMISAAKKYALFKPVFSPISGAERKADGVAFDFSYQPGFVFFISPDSPTLNPPKFSTPTCREWRAECR